MLPLPPAIRVTYLNPLELILDRSDLVLQAKVFHVRFIQANYVFDLSVIFHGHVLRKRQVTHELSLELAHTFDVSLGLGGFLGRALTKQLGIEVLVLQVFDDEIDQILRFLDL